MSATQTIAVQEILVKHKFSKKEAAEILDYVDKRKDKSIDRLWIALGILGTVLTAFIIGGFAWLASEIKDTRQELKVDMRAMEGRLLKAIEKNK